VRWGGGGLLLSSCGFGVWGVLGGGGVGWVRGGVFGLWVVLGPWGGPLLCSLGLLFLSSEGVWGAFAGLPPASALPPAWSPLPGRAPVAASFAARPPPAPLSRLPVPPAAPPLGFYFFFFPPPPTTLSPPWCKWNWRPAWRRRGKRAFNNDESRLKNKKKKKTKTRADTYLHGGTTSTTAGQPILLGFLLPKDNISGRPLVVFWSVQIFR